MHFELTHEVCTLSVDVVFMGEDLSVCICGGVAHVGCCVMAVPRPSLTGFGMSATVSCLNRTGHMDDQIGARVAKRLSAELNCVVSCTCGIHVDSATKAQVESLLSCADELANAVLVRVKERG